MPGIVVIQKQLEVQVHKPFSVMCQYPLLMCGLVSVMAWSSAVMSQKGQLKHQGHFSDSSPVTSTLGQINSHLYFSATGSVFSVVSQTSCTLLCFRVSVTWKEPLEAVSILTASELSGLLHGLTPFTSIYMNCCTGGKNCSIC